MLRALTGVSSGSFCPDGDFERALHWSASAQAPGLASAILLHAGLRSGHAHSVDEPAARLLSDAEPGDSRLRGSVLLALAGTHFWHGAHDDVDALLSGALASARDCGDVRLQADVLAMASCADSYRVRPCRAQAAALRARRLLRGSPGLSAPPALRLAAAIRFVQQADLAGARRTLRAVAASDAPGLAGQALLLWQSTVLWLSGQPDEALTLLEVAPDGPWPAMLLVHRDVLLAETETSQGRPHAALKILDRHRDGMLSAPADVSRARARLALDDLLGARQCVHGVLSGTRPRLSRYVLVEALLLGATIAVRARDPVRALEMITNALDVADGDLVLPFARACQPLGGLFARHPSVAHRWPVPPPGAAPGSRSGGAPGSPSGAAPGSRSGAVAGAGPPGGSRPAAAVCPPRSAVSWEGPLRLTQREKSILAYLATSMTAGEIADELYLSVNTVKTHLAAIYRKLGAGGRRAAVRRARELELL